MSKVKKLAEEFLARHPDMFSTDFEANKRALDQIAIIRNRALRNQIAGAITAMAGDIGGEESETKDQNGSEMSPPVSSEGESMTQQA